MANPYEPPADPFPGAPAALSTGEYEFNDQENQIIDKAGRRARLWGIFSFVIGGLSMVAALAFLAMSGTFVALGGSQFGTLIGALVGGAAVFMLVNGIVYAVMGKLYVDAGAALRDVVVSEGSDVAHMMRSLGKLGTAFQIEAILTIAAFALGFVGSLIAIGSQAAGAGP